MTVSVWQAQLLNAQAALIAARARASIATSRAKRLGNLINFIFLSFCIWFGNPGSRGVFRSQNGQNATDKEKGGCGKVGHEDRNNANNRGEY